MPDVNTLLFRLFLVIIVGGLIGAEREYRSKSAGFRTMILICLGSFLFTTFSIHISNGNTDRIASNIVTGIGFLGAGVIYQSGDRINGLTTAACIWAVAALGMGIADGAYYLVLLATIIILSSLFLFTRLEHWIDTYNQSRNYKIVTSYAGDVVEQYEGIITKSGLRYKRMKQTKLGNNITCLWLVQGTKKNHAHFVDTILKDGSVKEFEF
jgi:putative Mg2+ transporter-C (MgtC) family protein